MRPQAAVEPFDLAGAAGGSTGLAHETRPMRKVFYLPRTLRRQFAAESCPRFGGVIESRGDVRDVSKDRFGTLEDGESAKPLDVCLGRAEELRSGSDVGAFVRMRSEAKGHADLFVA